MYIYNLLLGRQILQKEINYYCVCISSYFINCYVGSFKARGLANQLANLPPSVIKENKSLVAMSSGNYGRAIACAAQLMGLPATVVLPDVAPINRVKILEVLKLSLRMGLRNCLAKYFN